MGVVLWNVMAESLVGGVATKVCVCVYNVVHESRLHVVCVFACVCRAVCVLYMNYMNHTHGSDTDSR